MKLLVDLDGTVCKPSGNYPEIGEPKKDVIVTLNHLKKDGYEVWIHTCRDWRQEKKIKQWCEENHLHIDGVICGKPLGIFIDDLAIEPMEEQDLKTKITEKTDRLKREWRI